MSLLSTHQHVWSYCLTSLVTHHRQAPSRGGRHPYWNHHRQPISLGVLEPQTSRQILHVLDKPWTLKPNTQIFFFTCTTQYWTDLPTQDRSSPFQPIAKPIAVKLFACHHNIQDCNEQNIYIVQQLVTQKYRYDTTKSTGSAQPKIKTGCRTLCRVHSIQPKMTKPKCKTGCPKMCKWYITVRT